MCYAQLNVHYGHLGTNKKCPEYLDVPIFLVILYNEVLFGTSTECVYYPGVHYQVLV